MDNQVIESNPSLPTGTPLTDLINSCKRNEFRFFRINFLSWNYLCFKFQNVLFSHFFYTFMMIMQFLLNTLHNRSQIILKFSHPFLGFFISD